MKSTSLLVNTELLKFHLLKRLESTLYIRLFIARDFKLKYIELFTLTLYL